MPTDMSDFFERAEALYNKSLNEGSSKEIQFLLEQAEAQRAAYAAIVGLCDYLNRWNAAGKMNLTQAASQIKTALKINPNLALAYYAQGFIHRTEGKHTEALASFTKSLEIDDAYARAHAQRGAELLYIGHPEEALCAVRKAIELTPPGHYTLGMFYWIMGRTHFFMQDYKETIPCLRRSIEMWPTLWYNRLYLVSAYALSGDIDNAHSELETFDSKFPGYSIARVVKNEKTNPNKNEFVVEGRRKFHSGLRKAGMPRSALPGYPVSGPPATP